jgi:hypothetical protein
MPLCGATFDENSVAQTAAFGGLRLFASESRTAADQPKNGWSALHSLLVYFQESFVNENLLEA